MKKILSIVGARPNFMKVAPLHRAFLKTGKIDSSIVHTGQHYDAKMSDVFFEQLELPKPDWFLGIGGGSHTQQTARIMLEFEKVVEQEKPDLILVVGDVNSTIACTLVATKMGVPVAHVEAGLRSGDRSMPEEINRILTDSVADFLFVTEMAGMVNLAKEGVADEKIFFTGNVMIDSLAFYRENAAKTGATASFGLAKNGFALMTMHRPSNVDSPDGLAAIFEIVERISQRIDVLFPIHPRTKNNLEQFGLAEKVAQIPRLQLVEPQGYLEFLNLMEYAALVITDSGGIQEETTFLQVPCLTFRNSTERPVTVELGTNQLLSELNPLTVFNKTIEILEGKFKKGSIPPLWDGRASERIAAVLLHIFAEKTP